MRRHILFNDTRSFNLCLFFFQDKSIKGTVFKIAGVIPANNYIQVPKTGSQSLGLTGRYVYLAFKPIPERYFVAHLDVASSDGLIIRFVCCHDEQNILVTYPLQFRFKKTSRPTFTLYE